MEIGVWRLHFLSKFVTHDNIINHVLDAKSDISIIALKFSLDINSESNDVIIKCGIVLQIVSSITDG